MVAISDVVVLAQCALQTLDTASAQKRMKLTITGRMAKIFGNTADCRNSGFVVNF